MKLKLVDLGRLLLNDVHDQIKKSHNLTAWTVDGSQASLYRQLEAIQEVILHSIR